MALSNNITKSLGFNAYQLFYTDSDAAKQDCMRELNHRYNSDFLIELLKRSAELIGAQVLNISTELYKPHGTSVTMMVAEQTHTVLGHLDKSHLTVHTYADLHLSHDICSFRLDFDLASCGPVTPLIALPLLFDQVVSHLVTIDYRIRGYSRDGDERLIFTDHPIDSILQFIPGEYLSRYNCCTCDLPEHHLYHLKMMLKEVAREHRFAVSKEMSERESGEHGLRQVKERMQVLFEGI